MATLPVTLSARYVFPVEGPPIPDGIVEIRDGRIHALAGPGTRTVDLDLGNVAITPGFTNAHTHLELDPLEHGDNLSEPVVDEVAWLKQIVQHRRSTTSDDQAAAAQRNLASSLDAGTTMLADTTTAGLSWQAIHESGVRGVVFAEMIGLSRSRSLETNQQAWEWISSLGRSEDRDSRLRPGLSPHAPYSTAGWLYNRAASSRLPLSTHLAELPEELDLLSRGDGGLKTFLQDIGAWDEDWQPIGPRPADYVRRGELRQADWIIAHGTYLDQEDFWQLRPEAAPDGQRVAVAYCPRTHALFGHAPHPFREMLARGVVVCLGTDSLASSPSLSILDEMRFLHRREPDLAGELLLTMATLFGAWALRAESVAGSLKPGKSADLAIIGLPDRDERDPYRLLLDSNEPVLASLLGGRFVTGPWTTD